MIFQGTVQNGVVVFPTPIPLPEGAVVRVEPVLAAIPRTDGISSNDPLASMSDLAVETGMPDLAVNIDHSLYGHPKVTNAK